MSGFYDAHNHLQDARFSGGQEGLLATCRAAGVVRMVVNGVCEEDWPSVLALAREHAPLVVPSFGYHPWYIHGRPSNWERRLVAFLDTGPSGVGEIGLDRWKPGLAYEGQEEVFVTQLRLAAERNVPASIHCLRAWGRMLELLRENPRPACGFILHSYGGPQEMVKPLAELGAFFSFPGAFAHERKQRQQRAFLEVPADRFLVETDAPDQLPPEELRQHRVPGGVAGLELNHPANLPAIYGFAAKLVGVTEEALAATVAVNFRKIWSQLSDLNRRPTVYKTVALPLS